MVVWVLRRIYCCILLNAIMTNGCTSIMKDLLLYFIECNYDEWLYEYYEGSTVVFYWMQLWRMVVWVLWRIYCCILLNVIMTNSLWWILNWLWDVDWAIMNLGCWRMVVWVLRRIYCCILLNVIMMNGCMSITKDLLLYFIECNYDKWLYEYYEGSTIVFYWM